MSRQMDKFDVNSGMTFEIMAVRLGNGVSDVILY